MRFNVGTHNANQTKKLELQSPDFLFLLQLYPRWEGSGPLVCVQSKFGHIGYNWIHSDPKVHVRDSLFCHYTKLILATRLFRITRGGSITRLVLGKRPDGHISKSFGKSLVLCCCLIRGHHKLFLKGLTSLSKLQMSM
jgi:hypothetical protein